MLLMVVCAQGLTQTQWKAGRVDRKAITSLPVPVRTWAYTGQHPDGTQAGVVFDHLYPPTISPSNVVMVTGRLWGSGVNQSNNHGIWSGVFNSLLVARMDEQAPGFPQGTRFEYLGNWPPLIRPQDNVVAIDGGMYFATLTGVGTSLWEDRRSIAFSGQTPALSIILSPIRYNRTGLFSSISGQDTLILWRWDGRGDSVSILETVVKSYQQIPGLPQGNLFSGAATYLIGGGNHVAFHSGIRTFGGSILGYGIWRWNGHSFAEVFRAMSGEPVNLPGLNMGETISGVGYLLGNGASRIGLMAQIVGAPSGNGIWAEEAGSLQLVMRRGMAAPGTSQGVTFQSLNEFSTSPICVFFTDDEETIFMAKLEGTGINTTNDMGVWRRNSLGLHMVAREGDQMSGAVAGVLFDRIEGVASTRRGEIVVQASIRGPGITSANNLGIWALNPIGEFTPVIQKGDRIEVEPGVMRTVNGVHITGGDPESYSTGADGRSTVFSESKTLVFWTGFLDSSIVVSAVCVADLRPIFTDIQEESDSQLRDFTLHQNYPNPFNPSTRIRFSIPAGMNGHTSLRVYDVLGREVATLVNVVKEPGTYEVTWDATGHASGIYFCRLVAGAFSETMKLVLMR